MTSSRIDKDVRMRLELESVPGSVALIRSVIGTVARNLGFDRRLADDLRTAVSEAANNVVLHAYAQGAGPLMFSMAVRRDQIEAVVRDRGCGMRRVSLSSRGLGIGVVVISALADHAEFQSDELSGTEVRMTFKRPAPVPPSLSRFELGIWTLADDAQASIAP